jgi:hypothetical protein
MRVCLAALIAGRARAVAPPAPGQAPYCPLVAHTRCGHGGDEPVGEALERGAV